MLRKDFQSYLDKVYPGSKLDNEDTLAWPVHIKFELGGDLRKWKQRKSLQFRFYFEPRTQRHRGTQWNIYIDSLCSPSVFPCLRGWFFVNIEGTEDMEKHSALSVFLRVLCASVVQKVKFLISNVHIQTSHCHLQTTLTQAIRPSQRSGHIQETYHWACGRLPFQQR